MRTRRGFALLFARQNEPAFQGWLRHDPVADLGGDLWHGLVRDLARVLRSGPPNSGAPGSGAPGSGAPGSGAPGSGLPTGYA